MQDNNWGKLAAFNLSGCDYKTISDKSKLIDFSIKLCERIGMKPHGEPLIKRFGSGSLEGYTLVQLIETSSITIHADELGKRVFIDLFSCKDFNSKIVEDFSVEFFKAKRSNFEEHYRK